MPPPPASGRTPSDYLLRARVVFISLPALRARRRRHRRCRFGSLARKMTAGEPGGAGALCSAASIVLGTIRDAKGRGGDGPPGDTPAMVSGMRVCLQVAEMAHRGDSSVRNKQKFSFADGC